MNRKKISLCALIIVSGVQPLFSQSAPLTGAPNAIIDTETWLERNKLRTYNDNDGTLGDRFLFEEWKTGSIKATDSLQIDKIDLKYDLLFDALIGKLHGSMTTLRKENIREFTINDDGEELHFQTMFHNNSILFLEIVYSGNSINLYKKHSVRLEKKDSGNQAYGSGVAYDKYVYEAAYFLEKNEEEIEPLKNTRGTILKLLSDRKDEIKSYMKKESIDVKEKKDLSLVFKYYESITN